MKILKSRPRSYKCLGLQIFEKDEYKLVPIRDEDRYAIMQWRNEQIYHLRQAEPLTPEKQDRYFQNVVAQLFDQEKPDQILFSFLKDNECIGYGGLVHINWIDRNAEVSLVISTEEQKQNFVDYWVCFLQLLKTVAIKQLDLIKIYTFAFDVRPRLYDALSKAGFLEEARLRDHCVVDSSFKDVLIHSFWNPSRNLEIRKAQIGDLDLYFKWANDSEVRNNAFRTEPIEYDAHVRWFRNKLQSEESTLYVFEFPGGPVGQVRLDKDGTSWVIDYSVSHEFRGLGLGKIMIEMVIEANPNMRLIGRVKPSNVASISVFRSLAFLELQEAMGDGSIHTFVKEA